MTRLALVVSSCGYTIEDLLVDPSVTEVMVNDGGRRVFIERDGALEAVAGRTPERALAESVGAAPQDRCGTSSSCVPEVPAS
jgi:Flp pilus assembly CpaF family ATPase